MNIFTEEVIKIIKAIPKGKVMTYGQIASEAGNPWGSRQIARILNSLSEKHNLPWHRVVNAKGQISIKGHGGLYQKQLLVEEDIEFINESIDLEKYRYVKD